MTNQEIENAAIEHFNATRKHPAQSAHVCEGGDGALYVRIDDGTNTYELRVNEETGEVEES